MNKKSELKGHNWRPKGALQRVVWVEAGENLGAHENGDEEPAAGASIDLGRFIACSLLILLNR